MSRIVRCPKCESLLREPAAETPFYQCSKCSTVLQAKHAKWPIECEQLFGKEESGNRLLTNSSFKIDNGLSKVVSEGELKNSSGDGLSTSLPGKDTPFDRKKSHPKTVRTFRAFSRYKTIEDAPLPFDSTCSKENNQVLANALDSSVQDIYFEDFAATFDSMCSQKNGIGNGLSKCFKSMPAPESCHEDKKLVQSQLASPAHAEQSGELNLQLNTTNSANEKATLEASTTTDLFKKPESTACPLRCRHEENASLSVEMPCIKSSVRQVTQEDASQFEDSVSYSPVVRVKSSNQHARNGGKLNPTSNFTMVLSDENRFGHKQSHGLVEQSLQRSEDLYEATSEIDDYELSEFSSNMDEADAFDSGSPSQPSEDMDFSHTSQLRMGASATTLREFTRHGVLEEVEISTSPSLKKVDEHVHLWDHKATDINRKVLSHINTSSTHLLHKSPESTSLHVRENCIPVQHKQKLQEKNYPYWPSENQSPYVLCQHCRCLLKVPHGLHTYNKIIQKLRCGGCSKISVFSLQQPNFVIEKSVSPGPHFSHSPVNSSKDDTYDSSDDSSTSKFRNQMQASIAQLKEKAVKSFKGSKFRHQTDTLNVSNVPEKEFIRQGEEVFPTSVGQGEKKQNAEFLKTKENTGFDSFSNTDPKASCNNSFQNTRTDSDCDSCKSAEETSFATSSPVGMSPLQELFGYGSPLHSFENESLKDAVDETQRGFKSRMKSLIKGRKRDLFKVHSKVTHPKVLVNGNVILHSLVKKAEESAGPIHPGSYWYDIRAGFWGVMGGPCLGIVAPFIEEFDFPLSRQCSGGNTGILVNGRELHQTDFEKLVRRGLPSTQGKTYKVEIDGRLIDEASGEELRGLGKLAPSIERRGCGFGMFMPVGQ